jgi:prepilin-type N-terminal cleavage/methylation domain-containing protein
MRQTNKGFTLVEMLVVISIISLLSSVVLSAVNGARTKAEIAQISQIIGEYRKALTFGYDKYGGYPYSGDSFITGHCLGNHPSGTCRDGTVDSTINSVAGEFLPPLPVLKTATYGGIPYGGPFYYCKQLNSSADNRGACSKAEVYWDLPITSSFTGRCEPGKLVGGTILSQGFIPYCQLVLE